MRKTWLLLIFCGGLLNTISKAQGSEDEIKWLVNFDSAKLQSTATGKPILMYFSGSDWCQPCMRLKKDLFESNEFKKFSKDHLVLLLLDFPARKKNQLSPAQKKHNDALAKIHNKYGQFPRVLVFGNRGNYLGTMTYPLRSVEGYISSIKKIIK